MPIIEREHEIARIDASGWKTLTGLPPNIGEELREFLLTRTSNWWQKADAVAVELDGWLRDKRFGNQVELGLLYVPSPTILDTRTPMNPRIRQEQRDDLLEDVIDPRLGAGSNLVSPTTRGSLFVTCVGQYGPALGSFTTITESEAASYTVADYDVRQSMTRQLWGARVLQSGRHELPDTELNGSWTFTLFVGDGLVEGMAGSGTILKSHCRFRLGKANRGIGSARAVPAVPVDVLK